MSVIHNGKTINVKKLKGLATLNLARQNITSISEINGLENLEGLQVLILSNNNISEIEGLDTLTNLLVLKLRNNRISEIKGLENLVKIQELYLEKNPIKTLKGLDNLVELKFLNLFACSIDDIESFRNKQRLVKFFFGRNPLYQNLYDIVSKKKKLRKLTEEERNNRGIDSKLWEIVDNTEFKLFVGGQSAGANGSIYSSTPKLDSIELGVGLGCFIVIAIFVIIAILVILWSISHI